jgi:sulfur relay (sulfurtransferase) complex TusBCD TusD component (DsrE family)
VRYLLIETRSPWEGGDVGSFLELAMALSVQGEPVDLFLLQNGVALARLGADPRMGDLAQTASVSIWADAFALRQRSLSRDSLFESVREAGMPDLIRLLALPDCKPIWHA